MGNQPENLTYNRKPGRSRAQPQSQSSTRPEMILFHLKEFIKEQENELLTQTDQQSLLIQEIKKKKKRGYYDEARQLQLSLQKLEHQVKQRRIKLHLLSEQQERLIPLLNEETTPTESKVKLLDFSQIHFKNIKANLDRLIDDDQQTQKMESKTKDKQLSQSKNDYLPYKPRPLRKQQFYQQEEINFQALQQKRRDTVPLPYHEMKALFKAKEQIDNKGRKPQNHSEQDWGRHFKKRQIQQNHSQIYQAQPKYKDEGKSEDQLKEYLLEQMAKNTNRSRSRTNRKSPLNEGKFELKDEKDKFQTFAEKPLFTDNHYRDKFPIKKGNPKIFLHSQCND